MELLICAYNEKNADDVECALGDINTDESKNKLELIATDKTLSEEIRSYAINQLNRKR